jgi:hypothetical protein
MKVVLASLAVLCAAAAPAAGAARASAPSPSAATAAFGQLLHQRYGSDLRGYWTCPAGQKGVGGSYRLGCLGEAHTGKRWHQVSADAGLHQGRIVFAHVSVWKWTRHWWPYSRHFIRRSREPQVPGVVSVNSLPYDWGWLAMGAESLKPGATLRVDAYDGDGAALGRFFMFRCSRNGGLVTCRNALGDAMRYRPSG